MRVFVVISVVVQQCFNLLVHMLFLPVVIHGYEAAGRKCHWLHFSLRFFDRTLEKRNMKKRLFISPEVLLFFRIPCWHEHFSRIVLSINQGNGGVERKKGAIKANDFSSLFLNVCSGIFGNTVFNHLSIFHVKVKNK